MNPTYNVGMVCDIGRTIEGTYPWDIHVEWPFPSCLRGYSEIGLLMDRSHAKENPKR